MTGSARIELRYTARPQGEDWVIPEEWPVPEAVPHALAVDHLVSVLSFWASRQERKLFVARSLAVRWLEERPGVGIDPDVALLDPPPDEVLGMRSLCLWKPGHVAPKLSFEVVSHNHPYKDYVGVQERYAAFGARELVVFDPMRVGPRALGGPFAIQVWRRDDAGIFARQYAGDGPVFLETLRAWALADGALLEIADDHAGKHRWPTTEAYERAEKERERAEKERERVEKERERAEKERERAARLEVEERLAALERSLRDRRP